LEYATLTLEGLINRLTDARYNPLYHTSTLAVWLLTIVAVSGLGLVLIYFAIFGLVPSVAFISIERLNDFWLGRLLRSVHRYAADLAVIVILLHALRVCVTDRFSGSRWLAWVSGVILLGLVVLIGILGFWLPGDMRAQWIGLVLGRLLGNPAAFTFLTNAELQKAYYLFFLILILHIGLGGFVALLLWLHTLRLNRAKLLPPRFWVYSVLAILGVLAVIRPAILPPAADMRQLPTDTLIDPFYLLFLPIVQSWGVPLFVGVSLVGWGLAVVWPWLYPRRAPAATVKAETCTGCTLCAKDCPYAAIEMQPHANGHPHKLAAVVRPGHCVACGVCLGACSWDAIDLPGVSLPAPGPGLAGHARVMLVCQRHTVLGALNGLGTPGANVLTVPCAGAIHPAWVLQAQQAGAAEVMIVGCLAEDCAYREGSQWLAERLAGTRPPVLPKEVDRGRLRSVWVAPNDVRGLQRALAPHNLAVRAANRLLPRRLHLKPAQFLPGLALLAALVVGVIWTADLPFRPYPADLGQLKVSLAAGGQFRATAQALSPQQMARLPQGVRPEDVLGAERYPVYVELDLDGRPHLRKTYSPGGLRRDGLIYALEEVLLPPGDHQVEIRLDDAGGQQLRTVYQGVVEIKPAQVRVLIFDAQAQTFILH